MAREAVIVEAVRSPMGRRNGKLKDIAPADLLGDVFKELINRSGIDPNLVEDVIGGCVQTVGEQTFNITRWGWLAAGLPETVPATTVDRQCGSSQQAACFAAQAIMAGAHDLLAVGGVEHMTRVPMGSAMANGMPFTKRILDRYDNNLVGQGISAELIGARWGISRQEVDEIGYRSQVLAAKAWNEGRYAREVVPIKVTTESGATDILERDECMRETSMEKLGSLKAAFYTDAYQAQFPEIKNWIVTAGNSSQISDGAAAMLVTTPEKAKELGLKPRARFHTFALAAADPIMMLTAPSPATKKALDKGGLKIEDIDVVEINEAFANVVAMWKRDLGVSDKWFDEHVNPNGGAIALGHPLGASGARLMVTMLHELERSGGKYGLQTMCEGGGTANATIIERL